MHVFKSFTHTDIFYRNVKLGLNSHCYSALGRSVQFGKDKARDLCGLGKFLCLHKGILSCGSIKYHQGFKIGLRIFLIKYLINLMKLRHKILLIVKAAGSITDKNVRISCLCGGNGIKNHRCRISSFIS